MARLRVRITCSAAEIGATLRRRFAPQPEVLLLRLDLHFRTTEAPGLDFESLECLISADVLNFVVGREVHFSAKLSSDPCSEHL